MITLFVYTGVLHCTSPAKYAVAILGFHIPAWAGYSRHVVEIISFAEVSPLCCRHHSTYPAPQTWSSCAGSASLMLSSLLNIPVVIPSLMLWTESSLNAAVYSCFGVFIFFLCIMIVILCHLGRWISGVRSNVNIDTLLYPADKALYEAKEIGRNKVCVG